MSPTFCRVAPIALLGIIACAGSSNSRPPASGSTPLSGASNAPPPGSGTELLSTWTATQADTSVHVLYARNNTAEPITIASVTIVRCENIVENCGDHPVNVVVPPGKAVDVFRIRRLNSRLAWSWEYRVHTAPQSVAVIRPPAQNVVMTPGGTPFVARTISVDSFHALVPAITTGAECAQNVTIPDLPAGHRAFLLLFSSSLQHGARGVIVRFDANGNAYDYSETRNGPPGDSSRTTIALDLVRQTGLLRNAHGNASTEWFHVAGADLLTAESLGRPGEMIARIKRECGGQTTGPSQ